MKHLIFLDIDGTLIQPNQRPNTDKLFSVIKRLSRKGVLFALNSNRSLEDVRSIYRKFALNGPMILENGVYFIDNGKRKMLIRNIMPIRARITRIVRDFVKKNNLECKVLCTDTVRIIKSKELERISLIVLINGYRKYTASIHIFRYGIHDRELARKLTKYIKARLLDEKIDFRVESPKSFGNVIAFPKDADKGSALKKIKEYYPKHTLYMIGDDSADLKTLREIRGFYAVGNAQKDVRTKADYVSPLTYTKGVVDILEYFEKLNQL